MRFNEKAMVLILETTDEDGEDLELRFPAKFVVCGGCGGKGQHVNRAIDAHGISPEEFAEDPDFEEAYFGGLYDVSCDTCHGQRVEPVVDENAAKPEDLKRLYAWEQGEADYAAECAAEARMGC